MAFFNFRLPGQTASDGASETLHTTPAESLEVLRKRARHRLIGSVVLVLAAVIGFPLLFDTQPRPMSVDTPIVIPERNAAVSSAAVPVAKPAAVTAVAGAVSPAPASASPQATGPLPPAGVLDANEEVVQASPRAPDKAPTAVQAPAPSATASGFKVDFGKTGGAAGAPSETKTEPKVQLTAKPAEPQPAQKSEVKVEAKVERKPEPKAETKTAASPDKAPDKAPDEGAKARALLEGKEPAKSAKPNEERMVIQVGAYNDANKVREARQKLEAAGFKTYTQVIDGKDGKRTRVRVGPFDSKAEADKSAQKIRKLQLDAAILKL